MWGVLVTSVSTNQNAAYQILKDFGDNSDHIRMVPACSRGYDNHIMVLPQWDITVQVHLFDIPQGHRQFSGNGSTSFFIDIPFIYQALGKGASITNLKYLVLTRTENDTPIPPNK